MAGKNARGDARQGGLVPPTGEEADRVDERGASVTMERDCSDHARSDP